MRSATSPAMHNGIVTVVILALTATMAIYLTSAGAYRSFVALIFMAGTVGGVANNYRRVLQLPRLEAPDDVAHRLVIFQIYLSPLIGGVFGTVLYIIFMAGILQGALFPVFQAIDLDYESATTFSEAALPKSNADAAKAILWAFIAGFAEMFVPNVIDKIVRDAALDDTGKPAKPAKPKKDRSRSE